MGQITEKIGILASEIELNVRAKQLSRQREKNKKKNKREYEARVDKIKKEMAEKREKEQGKGKNNKKEKNNGEFIDKLNNVADKILELNAMLSPTPRKSPLDIEREKLKKEQELKKEWEASLANKQSEEKEKKSRPENIRMLEEVMRWKPFENKYINWEDMYQMYFMSNAVDSTLESEPLDETKLRIIGFREIKMYGGSYLELVLDNGKSYYVYYEKKLYDTLQDKNEIKRNNESINVPEYYYVLSDKLRDFYQSLIPIDDLISILELVFPKFSSINDFNGIKVLIENQEYALEDTEYFSRLIRSKEVPLLGDISLMIVDKICNMWNKNSYAPVLGVKTYEVWKNRMQSIDKLAISEEIKKRGLAILETYNEREEVAQRERQKEAEKGRKEAGKAGEQEVEYQLKWLPKEYMVVEKKTSGILLAHPDFGNEKQEIDHIVVGPQGVFLIETKAYSGIIRIDAQGNWTRSKGDGGEEGLRNPVAQVNRHHLVVEKILGISEIYDIICIANDKSIIEGAENSVVPVVKSDMLGHYISNYKTDSDKIYGAGEIKELKAKLESSMLENEA